MGSIAREKGKEERIELLNFSWTLTLKSKKRKAGFFSPLEKCEGGEKDRECAISKIDDFFFLWAYAVAREGEEGHLSRSDFSETGVEKKK